MRTERLLIVWSLIGLVALIGTTFGLSAILACGITMIAGFFLGRWWQISVSLVEMNRIRDNYDADKKELDELINDLGENK